MTNLFLSTKEPLECKFLSRLLINDLRIGVSEGVLKEAMTNSYFPKIVDIHKYCSNCNYFNLNLDKCAKCSKAVVKDKNEQLDMLETKFEIVNLSTPKNTKGLDKFVDYKTNPVEFALRRDKDKYIILADNPREIYNQYLSIFEKKYNLVNSFEEIAIELNEDFTNINKFEIKLSRPIKSMLAPRVNSVKEGFDITSTPAMLDFKYDGLRMQIHNDRGKVNLFTRNLDNITGQFPEVVDYIKTNFSDLSFVLDSECIGFDFRKKKFLPFQMLSKRILTKAINEVSNIHIVVRSFDILYLNGETLIDLEYFKRREKLKEIMLNRKIKQKINFDIDRLRE